MFLPEIGWLVIEVDEDHRVDLSSLKLNLKGGVPPFSPPNDCPFKWNMNQHVYNVRMLVAV